MELVNWIRQQIESVNMPLFAVTVTAVPKANTPVLLLLHWHGFHRETPLSLPGMPEITPPKRSVPGSALQIDQAWQTIADLDFSALDAGWQLGAWDVERTSRRGCNTPGASALEAYECRQAFGDYITDDDPEQHLLDGAPDREELMQLAAKTGYFRWLFRPRAGKHDLWQDDDITLQADGSREPPCPVLPHPRARRNNSKTTYRLGQASMLAPAH